LSYAQILKPYFNKSEYIELLKINQKAHISIDEWPEDTLIGLPNEYHFNDRSPIMAFDNIWDFWIHKKQPLAVIAIRGSIATEASFLANFYAAMIPAKGSIELNENTNFEYELAKNPNAAVHAGWLISMAHLSESIKLKIDSSYKAGIKDFILTGHSQGGGITFLLTAYLRNLQEINKLPRDIQFKTYCSAGPKPGNLFFAYEYENITQGGWACNVVNTLDWVPDVPFSLQTLNDFTAVNPFSQAEEIIKKQKFPKKLVLKKIYKDLTKPSLTAQENYEKYLGKMVSKAVKKQLPNIQIPDYYQSNYYVRTGRTIALIPTEDYYKIYPNDPKSSKIWIHHLISPYLYLVNCLD
jgi:hypothetical protein